MKECFGFPPDNLQKYNILPYLVTDNLKIKYELFLLKRKIANSPEEVLVLSQIYLFTFTWGKFSFPMISNFGVKFYSFLRSSKFCVHLIFIQWVIFSLKWIKATLVILWYKTKLTVQWCKSIKKLHFLSFKPYNKFWQTFGKYFTLMTSGDYLRT